MSPTTRRGFLTLAGESAFALGTKEFLGAVQLPGQATKRADTAQDAVFSSVMAIAGHPGDAFFAMGAPVASATRSGGKGWLLSLSLGERGSATIPVSQYGTLQRQAAEKAAAMIRAQALLLQYPDGEIPINEEAKFAVCDLIREHKPATVITHWKGSWHKDHRACHDIVEDAIFYAGLPSIVRKQPAHAVRRLFFAENWEDADGFVPDTYLDISPVFDDWLNACNAFPMWRGENGFRYNDYYSSLAVQRGCLSNSRHAVCLMSSAEQKIQYIRNP